MLVQCPLSVKPWARFWVCHGGYCRVWREQPCVGLLYLPCTSIHYPSPLVLSPWKMICMDTWHIYLALWLLAGFDQWAAPTRDLRGEESEAGIYLVCPSAEGRLNVFLGRLILFSSPRV